MPRASTLPRTNQHCLRFEIHRFDATCSAVAHVGAMPLEKRHTLSSIHDYLHEKTGLLGGGAELRTGRVVFERLRGVEPRDRRHIMAFVAAGTGEGTEIGGSIDRHSAEAALGERITVGTSPPHLACGPPPMVTCSVPAGHTVRRCDTPCPAVPPLSNEQKEEWNSAREFARERGAGRLTLKDLQYFNPSIQPMVPSIVKRERRAREIAEAKARVEAKKNEPKIADLFRAAREEARRLGVGVDTPSTHAGLKVGAAPRVISIVQFSQSNAIEMSPSCN